MEVLEVADRVTEILDQDSWFFIPLAARLAIHVISQTTAGRRHVVALFTMISVFNVYNVQCSASSSGGICSVLFTMLKWRHLCNADCLGNHAAGSQGQLVARITVKNVVLIAPHPALA